MQSINEEGWFKVISAQPLDENLNLVVQFHQKPDMYGPDYRKLTYVMYVNDGSVAVDRPAKETQTSLVSVKPTFTRDIQVLEPPRDFLGKVAPPDPLGRAYDDGEKRKLISDFVYKPSEDKLFKPIEPQAKETPVKDYTTDYIPKESKKKKKKPKAEKARKAPKSWQLRAGADSAESEDVEYDDFDQEVDQDLRYKREAEIDSISRYDRLSLRRRAGGEVLLDSPSKTNKYLYVPKDRIARTSRDRKNGIGKNR